MVWLGTIIGEWILDTMLYRKIGLNKLEKILKEQQRKKLK